MELDLKKINLREVNEKLQNLDRKQNQRDFSIINPEGNHAICAGLTEEMNVNIKGHVGYYCAWKIITKKSICILRCNKLY